jgi:hypothetical protein
VAFQSAVVKIRSNLSISGENAKSDGAVQLAGYSRREKFRRIDDGFGPEDGADIISTVSVWSWVLSLVGPDG